MVIHRPFGRRMKKISRFFFLNMVIGHPNITYFAEKRKPYPWKKKYTAYIIKYALIDHIVDYQAFKSLIQFGNEQLTPLFGLILSQ